MQDEDSVVVGSQSSFSLFASPVTTLPPPYSHTSHLSPLISCLSLPLSQPVPCCVNDPVPPIPPTACCPNQRVWICYLLIIWKSQGKLEARKGAQVITRKLKKSKQGTINCLLGWLWLRVEVCYSYHMWWRTWSWIPGERLSLGSRVTAPTLSGWGNGQCTCLAMLKWLLMLRWFEFNGVCDLSLLWLRSCVNKRARSLDTDSRWRPLLHSLLRGFTVPFGVIIVSKAWAAEDVMHG